MRLLKAEDYADFSLTEYHGDNIPQYAILSHTWGTEGDEVDFKDIVGGTGQHKIGYDKIRFCAKQAANDGLQFFWVDTCCIDKSSSAELSEAINSMFRWYREAAKCYVYLLDVSKSESSEQDHSSQSAWELAFRESRWFTRGWTLQELIAPSSVEFFSLEGERLGDRASLEQQIHEITGIGIQALRGKSLSDFSVSERMSWAAKRRTTRKEDRAYSLLGIFDIHMPLIYGEGEKAFLRLNEEIGKSSNVQSRGQVQRWLSPSNVADDLQKLVEDCMPGSCDWLLTRPYLQSFLTSTGPTLAHIQGRPGAGKSTTAAFFIQHLLSAGGPIVLYFFCRANDVEKRQPIRVLRTLLSQLLRADAQLYPLISEIYSQSGRAIADSHTEVEAALETAFANIKEAQIFIIIDALDECHEVRKLLESIFRCTRSGRSTTRVLVTSRPMSLEVSPDYEIRMDVVGSTVKFLEAYILQRVEDSHDLRGSELGKRVASKVFSAADGLWLYARLMMDEIARMGSSARIIEQLLQAIPRGLTQLYTQILRSSEQQFSFEKTKFAQQIFLWLDINDYLPGFLVTGYEGLSYKTLSLILQYVNFGQPVFDPIALAREICSPLVEVHEVSYPELLVFEFPTTTRDFELDYVHHSAKQYILESFTSPLNELPRVLRPRRFRHFHRAAVAMWYFSECSESEQYLNLLKTDLKKKRWNQSYFDMAYGIWGALKLSEFEAEPLPEEIPELTSIIRELCKFITSTRCLRWIETAIIVNYSAGYYHLLLNATDALKATATSSPNTKGMDIWNEYQETRFEFLSNFAYVLELTGPPPEDLVFRSKPIKPSGFDNDPLALEILKLGDTWHQEW